MFRKLVLIALIINLRASQCSEGCSICDLSRSKCRYCDPNGGFITVDGRCVQTTIPNCALASSSGVCLKCKSGYFFDSNLKICVLVPPGKQISNCLSYSNQRRCLQCSGGFYSTQTDCVQVLVQISNCQVYGSTTTCLQCSSGSVLNSNATACVTVSSSDDCAAYSSVDCLTCESGFIRNPNAYIYQIAGENPIQMHAFEKYAGMIQGGVTAARFPVCQILQLQNCLDFSSFNRCRTCTKGFYLNSQYECVANPLPAIPSCVMYSSPTQCTQCVTNMYLLNGTTCTSPSIPVNNCRYYDNTASTISCIECISGYYLSEPNVCTQRTTASVIKNCVNISLISETCLNCQTGFVLTTDYGSCLPALPNCITYQVSSAASTALSCATCVNGYYYDLGLNICVKGTKDYCTTYNINDNNCAVCFNKFYSVNGVCKPHDELYLCDQYDNVKKNNCATCKSSAFLFNVINSCVLVTPIDNCIQYATVSSCAVCADDYMLNAAGKCDLIPISLNCIQMGSNNMCVKCHANYVLNNGLCQNYDDELIFYCGKNNLDGLINSDQLSCAYCKNNSIPFNMKNFYSCVASNTVATAAIPNCDQFDVANQLCIKCTNPFVLLNGACVATCTGATGTETLYLQTLNPVDTNGDGINDSYIVNAINVCSTTIPNCSIAAPDLIQADPSVVKYTCVSCATGFLPKISLPIGSATTSRKLTETTGFKNNAVSFLPGFDCVNPNDNTFTIPTVRPLLSDNSFEFCDYYQQIGTWLGCVKCAHGYNGVVINNIFGCQDYDVNFNCIRCRQGYWLSDVSGKVCSFVTPITNCITYYNEGFNGCTSCRDHFKLAGLTSQTNYAAQTISVGSSCTKRTGFTLHCITYDATSEVCVTCRTGFYLSATNTCLAYPPFCKTVSVADVCTACVDGYYLDTNNNCYFGEVANCLTYTTVSNVVGAIVAPNTCSKCAYGYYLSNNNCLSHVSMPNCNITSQVAQNVCNICEPNYFRFTIQNKCMPYIVIPNCISYSSIYQCTQCQDGYYVANYGQRCIQIPATSGCIVMNGANCVKCQSYYYLYNNMCVSWFSDVFKNCDLTLGLQTDGLATAQQCAFCLTLPASTYEAIDLKDSYRCLESDVIAQQATLINYCIKYYYTGGQLTCVSCTAPYVLATNQLSCITAEACFASGSSVYLSQWSSVVDNSVTDSGISKVTDAICMAAPADISPYTQTNCYLAPAIDQPNPVVNTVSYYCVKCRDNWIGSIFTTKVSASYAMYGNQKSIGQKANPFNFYQAVSCKHPVTDALAVLGTVDSTNSIPFCEYYVIDGSSNWSCFKCQWGFQGVISVSNYIDYCQPISGCNTDIKLDNLSTSILEANSALILMASMFTCHQCTSATALPTIFLNMASPFAGITGYIPWYQSGSTYTTTLPANSNYNGPDIKCEDPSNAASTLNGKFTISNCALYAVDINNFSSNAKCAACQSGYVPVRAAGLEGLVTSCSPGANMVAASPVIFNGGVCVTGYVYYYTFVGGINTNQCVAHPDPLCYAANSPNSRCDVCKKEATYNPTTMLCEKMTVPYCTSVTGTSSRAKNLGRFAFFLGSGIGQCDTCDGGRIPARKITVFGTTSANAAFPVCVNKTPATAVVLPTKDNCSVVRFNLIYQRYDCTVCNSGWIVTADGECASAILNPSCTLVSTKAGTYCLNCIGNTISKSGLCVAKSITNCRIYMDSSTMSYIRCSTCNDGYYESFDSSVSVSTCIDATPLRLYNCAQYQTTVNAPYSVSCAKCAISFMLLPTAGSPVCHPIVPEIQDCTTYNAVNLATGALQCTACSTASQKVPVTNASFVKSLCIKYVGDPKCIQWGFVSALGVANYNPSTNTFQCTRCSDDSYINTVTGVCTTRRNVFGSLCKLLDYNDDKCITCINNYFINPSGTVCVPTPGVKSSPSTFYGFLSACSPMESCTEQVVDGLDVNISALLSCHKCVDSSRIPFLVVKGGYPYQGIQGLQSHSLTLANQTFGFDIGSYGKSTVCLSPLASSFSISNNLFAFPDNCAVGVVNANSGLDASHSKTLINIDLTKIAVFCGACLPGYKAIYGNTTVAGTSTAVKNMIAQCSQIANCEASTWYNYCSQCSPGYSYGWSTSTGMQYDSCVSNNNNQDCYAYNTLTQQCILCNRGLYLNPDGYCERIVTPRCQVDSFLQSNIYQASDIQAGLVLNPQAIGCTTCQSGYVAVLRSVSRYICSESSYQAKGLAPATSKLIYNCQNYFVESTGILKCFVCKPGWVPLNGYGSCIDASNLQNCQIATNANTCQTCLTGFVLVNRICVPQSLLNCVKYGNDNQSTEQICIGCAQGYYLEANTCKLGNVPNCLIYETRTRCNICQNGFQLVIRNNGANYCYPLDPQLKCAVYDPTNFQKAILSCTKCVNNTLIPSTDVTTFNPNYCLRYTQIRNCVQYDLRTTINAIADSTFSCVRCLSNFYLLDGICVPRLNLTPNCTVYNATADNCAVCASGMYLDINGVCQLYPFGIPGCVTYLNPTKCIACNSTSYLSNNNCIQLSIETIITNCLTHSAPSICSVCTNNYIVQNNNCTQILAQNCLTASSPFACQTCTSGFILKTNGNNIDCVQGTIDNCVTYEIKEPIRCITCKPMFYAKNGVCSAVNAEINRCIVYDSPTTCSQCESDTALSITKDSCDTSTPVFKAIDPFCTNSVITTKPFCSLCGYGKYLINGSCTNCPNLPQGCVLCDPQTPANCLTCATGYYMDTQGKCKKFDVYTVATSKVISN